MYLEGGEAPLVMRPIGEDCFQVVGRHISMGFMPGQEQLKGFTESEDVKKMRVL